MKIIIDPTKQAHTGNCCVCLAPTGIDELAAHFGVFLCARCANRDDVTIFNAARSYEEIFGDGSDGEVVIGSTDELMKSKFYTCK